MGERKKHKAACDYSLVKCNNTGCGFEDVRAKMKGHAEKCEWRTVQCKQGCSKVLKIFECDDHNCITSLQEDVDELKEENKYHKEELIETKELVKEL